jgi:hypothetical protein
MTPERHRGYAVTWFALRLLRFAELAEGDLSGRAHGLLGTSIVAAAAYFVLRWLPLEASQDERHSGRISGGSRNKPGTDLGQVFFVAFPLQLNAIQRRPWYYREGPPL